VISNILQNIDSVINESKSFHPIKTDISTTVGVIKGKDFGIPMNICVKRFNYKGIANYLFQLFLKNKSRSTWKINVKLHEKGLPVPKPITYIQTSLKQRNAYYLSYFIDHAESLGSIYKQGLMDKSREFAQALGKTIADWHVSGAIHGDLKWSNIIVQSNQNIHKFFFIDLDRSRLCSSPCIKGIMKDLIRFYRYGLELGAEKWVELNFLPAYLFTIPSKIRARLDAQEIKSKATKEWNQKHRSRAK
jgi:tRNA A-37 threonylcarbamoyl transferase component Bud32